MTNDTSVPNYYKTKTILTRQVPIASYNAYVCVFIFFFFLSTRRFGDGRIGHGYIKDSLKFDKLGRSDRCNDTELQHFKSQSRYPMKAFGEVMSTGGKHRLGYNFCWHGWDSCNRDSQLQQQPTVQIATSRRSPESQTTTTPYTKNTQSCRLALVRCEMVMKPHVYRVLRELTSKTQMYTEAGESTNNAETIVRDLEIRHRGLSGDAA